MSSKKHIVSYESLVNIYPEIVVPIKKLVPKWYKDLRQFHDNKVIDMDNGQIAKTLKFCTPFLDSLTTGYAITLPHDIAVGRDSNGEAWFGGSHDGESLVTNRNNKYNPTFPTPTGYDEKEVAWRLPTAISVPVGYSFMLTHPINRFDLPFVTLTGIVDGGFVLNALGNLPFYIKKDFEGIIEKGTPIAQIIPFKHLKWTAEEQKGLLKIGENHNSNMISRIGTSWYKKTWWNKKEYN
jgi:hypothetical protein